MPKDKKRIVSYTVALIPEDGTESQAFGGITRTKIIIIVFFLLFLGSILSSLLIAFTPLRSFIPGYTEPRAYLQQMQENQKQLDSLNVRVLQLDYYNHKLKLLLGAIPDSTVNPTTQFTFQNPTAPVQVFSKIAKGYSLKQSPENQTMLMNQFDSAPFVGSVVQGRLSQNFSPERSHYGIDVATAINEPVGSFADGVALFADWTNDYGWSVIVQHGTFTSFYKHCSKILIREGELVRRGQTIALTGNTGLESSGAHLHFELWKNGVPIDPSDFLVLN